jgi:predicted dinucleotide-binding enzyme
VLAVQWSVVKAAIEACGDLTGRLLIDVTNPLLFNTSGMELTIGFTTSAGEQVQAPGARVVKTLNKVGFDVLADASSYAFRPVMFVAGDDDEAKGQASGLVRDLGFDPEEGGPLKTARLLEPMAMLWIDHVYRRGAPRDCAFALLRRSGAKVP